jgi:hypothetical protein
MTTHEPLTLPLPTVPVPSAPSPATPARSDARSDSLSVAIRQAMHHEPDAAVVFAGADGRPVYWSRAFAEFVGNGTGPNDGSRQLAAATAVVGGNEPSTAPARAPAQALRAADGTVVGMKYRLSEHDRESRRAPAGDADANGAWLDELTALLRQAVEYGGRALSELAAHPVCDGVLLARLYVQRAIALAEQGRGLEKRLLPSKLAEARLRAVSVFG